MHIVTIFVEQSEQTHSTPIEDQLMNHLLSRSCMTAEYPKDILLTAYATNDDYLHFCMSNIYSYS